MTLTKVPLTAEERDALEEAAGAYRPKIVAEMVIRLILAGLLKVDGGKLEPTLPGLDAIVANSETLQAESGEVIPLQAGECRPKLSRPRQTLR